MNTKKILIIKWGALGDLIATTPAILKIREKFPNAHITYLSNNISKLITPANSIVDEIYDRKELKSSLGFLGFLKFIRKEKFDIVFNLKWGSESADILALFSRAKIKVGGSKKKIIRWLYDYSPPFLKDDYNRHEYLKNIDIINAYSKIDNDNKTEAYIHINNENEKYINNFLKNMGLKNNFIIISPAASTLKKAWSKEKYIQLSKKIIANTNYKIVATYSPNDFLYTQKIVNSIGDGAYLSPETTINDLAVLVKKSQLCICNNSGIMHVAYAVNTPVLCFNTSIGWHPFGRSDIAIDRIPKHIINNRSLSNNQVEELLGTIDVNEAYTEFKKWDVI